MGKNRNTKKLKKNFPPNFATTTWQSEYLNSGSLLQTLFKCLATIPPQSEVNGSLGHEIEALMNGMSAVIRDPTELLSPLL